MKIESPTPLDFTVAATCFAALGSEQRLAVLRSLVRAGPDGLSIGELGHRTGVTGSTLTHHLKILEQLMGLQAGMRVLDIGAGLGHQMVAFERAGLDAYGLEPSEPFRDYAISRTGIASEKISLTSIEDAVYEENSFDFVTLSYGKRHAILCVTCI